MFAKSCIEEAENVGKKIYKKMIYSFIFLFVCYNLDSEIDWSKHRPQLNVASLAETLTIADGKGGEKGPNDKPIEEIEIGISEDVNMEASI